MARHLAFGLFLCVVAACGGSGGNTAVDTTAGDPGGADADACAPVCTSKECGDDGCGGACGLCTGGEACDANGRCVAGASCVSDTPCVTNNDCEAGHHCNDKLVPPKCQKLYCGALDMACNEDALCSSGMECRDEKCACVPSCDGKQCGVDGCGVSCGECDAGFHCDDGTCVVDPCVPDCTGKECGYDGCVDICGECDADVHCDDGACFPGPYVPTGSACTKGAECETEACLTTASAKALFGDGFDGEIPNGMCWKILCTSEDQCGQSGVCAALVGIPTKMCLLPCDTDGDCRKAEGYSCFGIGQVGETKFCLPDDLIAIIH